MATSPMNVFSNQKLEPYYETPTPAEDVVTLPASISYLRGTLLGEVTATPGTFKAYTSGASDGSQRPQRILAFDCTTDASGNVTLTSTAGQVGGYLGQTQRGAPAYMKGAFRCEDLVQSGAGAIDANAITTGYLLLKNGTVAAGVVELL